MQAACASVLAAVLMVGIVYSLDCYTCLGQLKAAKCLTVTTCKDEEQFCMTNLTSMNRIPTADLVAQFMKFLKIPKKGVPAVDKVLKGRPVLRDPVCLKKV
ncbi:uncharacterized protein [Ambystoma mexicanum]|uniref:uncharacterized protein isoform X2 n=1 Tax=Ambystoma mexicanum TaxID=8296 RepID=UPI0037E96859